MKRRGALRFFGYIFLICILLTLMILMLNLYGATARGLSEKEVVEKDSHLLNNSSGTVQDGLWNPDSIQAENNLR